MHGDSSVGGGGGKRMHGGLSLRFREDERSIDGL
jgi:hypothetical protein